MKNNNSLYSKLLDEVTTIALQDATNAKQATQAQFLDQNIRDTMKNEDPQRQSFQQALSDPSRQSVTNMFNNDQIGETIGLEPDQISQFAQEYPDYSMEVDALMSKVLTKDNLVNVVRKSGKVAVVSNLILLKQKNLIGDNKFNQAIDKIYGEKGLQNIMRLDAFSQAVAEEGETKNAQADIIRTALSNGIVNFEDLVHNETEGKVLKNYLKGKDLSQNKYAQSLVNNIYNLVDGFVATVTDHFSNNQPLIEENNI